MVKNLDVPKDNKDKKYIVTIPMDGISVEGILRIPHNPRGIVLFVNGSSSRHNSRNDFVAEILRKSRTATLLFNLLTKEEDVIYGNRFNIELLTQRLVAATKWIKKQTRLYDLKIGYFTTSTGTAAALRAAARIGSDIKAIVSKSGRPDLAMDEIAKVRSATLLIIGENNHQVIELNQQAYGVLNTTKKLEIIPGATHIFEKPGDLEKAAELASYWFKQHLVHNFKESFRK